MHDIPIAGRCSNSFQTVYAEFERNFAARGDVGASVCIYVNGDKKVDLWGGYQTEQLSEPWAQDSISLVFSCTKAATALCAHRLIDRGALSLEAPIGDYWPEFAQAGKEDASVLMALNHSVGLPALRDPVKPDGYCDWDYMAQRLAQEVPFWTPGERNGYHMASFGWLVGELVRRVSGQSLGEFFRTEIAEPLGLDFHIGLPESEEPRVCPMIIFAPGPEFRPTDFVKALMSDPNSIQFLSLYNAGGTDVNERKIRAGELGGGGGVSNARAVAKMFAPLAMGGELEGVRVLSQSRIDEMRRPSVETREDQTLLLPSRFGQGFMLNMDNRNEPDGRQDSLILGKGAFGHTGMGGSVAFADPECALSFSYTMNKMGPGIFIDERAQSLIDACYRAIGYENNSAGYWR